jgi:hypothetical protein
MIVGLTGVGENKQPSIIRLYQGGRDCMVVGFTTTCAISAYYH